MIKAAAVIMVVLSSAGMAAAQAPGALPLPAPAPIMPETHDGEVSPTTAVLLSLGGTAASYAAMAIGHDDRAVVTMGALGTLILPSAGRWYAGSSGLGGLAIRGAGVATATLGFVQAFASCPLFAGDCDRSGADLGVALVILGGVAYAGGTVYDIFAAGRDAREHNARLHNAALVPVIHDHGGGVAFAAQF